ncbi:glycosyltransferase [Lactococcus termiticola]|uniref:glycosyltransferase n=1 Tax=Lactococcus termiticola TaxID=2169526 RepID=UPI001401BDDA|nr:glycosyltransferase [Lactococcus termiticola]
MLVSTMGQLGGVQAMNAWLADSLAGHYETAIYSRGEAKPSAFELKTTRFTDERDENWGLKFKLLTAFGLAKLGFLRKSIYKREADKIATKIEQFQADQVILSANEILFLPLLKAKFPALKFIAWLHSSAERYMTKVFFGLKADFLAGIRQADELVCLTDEDVSYFKLTNPRCRRIFNPNRLEHEQVSALKEPIIAWTGRLSYQVKGLDYLIELAKDLPEPWKIAVAGPGDASIFKDLPENKLLYRGALSGEELVQHYKEASIFLMTSRLEGFGLVLAEAMSFGLPAIAFEQTGSRAILDDGKYGRLIAQGDLEAMKASLQQLINNAEERKKLSQLSIERSQAFLPKVILEAWKELIEST